MNSTLEHISVVIPLYNETEVLPELHRQLTDVFRRIAMPYELILVDDGSTDNTLVALAALTRTDPSVRLVSLSRNFGHQAALTAGLHYATGRAVILMDGDLQDPPAFLPELIAKWREGFEVVYAVRTQRKENVLKRGAYRLFYRILHRISYLDIPVDSGDFCIMDRSIVEILNALPERNRFVRGLRTWVGFRQTGIPCERAARFAGTPKYNLTKLLRLAYDGLITFSYVPLKLSTKLGFVFSFLAMFFAALIIFLKFTTGFAPQGWASTIVVILFISALQFFILGIFGEYIGRIFEETKARPSFVVKMVMGFTTGSKDLQPPP